MAKTYPLDIQQIGDDVFALMSRGHHDPHEFMRKAREEGWDNPLGMPKQRWARAVPDRTGEYHCFYWFADAPGPGAFPVTYAEEPEGQTYEEMAAAMQAQRKEGRNGA